MHGDLLRASACAGGASFGITPRTSRGWFLLLAPWRRRIGRSRGNSPASPATGPQWGCQCAAARSGLAEPTPGPGKRQGPNSGPAGEPPKGANSVPLACQPSQQSFKLNQQFRTIWAKVPVLLGFALHG